MITDNFDELWLNQLTEKQRLDRLKRSFAIVKEVADKQLNLLHEFHKSAAPKDERFAYFYQTYKNAWQNAEFAINLGDDKNCRFSFYPVRMVLETTFRLEYFSHQKPETQMEIAQVEILRIAKRFFELEKRLGGDPTKFVDTYNFFAKDGDYPSIEEIDERNLDKFPSMKQLTSASKIEGGEQWYFHYQVFAEHSHGKLMSIFMQEEDIDASHRRSLMCLQVMCNDLIKNADFQLGSKTRDDVVQALKKAESIVKAPV
jgi:hypothetical protein